MIPLQGWHPGDAGVIPGGYWGDPLRCSPNIPVAFPPSRASSRALGWSIPVPCVPWGCQGVTEEPPSSQPASIQTIQRAQCRQHPRPFPLTSAPCNSGGAGAASSFIIDSSTEQTKQPELLFQAKTGSAGPQRPPGQAFPFIFINFFYFNFFFWGATASPRRASRKASR